MKKIIMQETTSGVCIPIEVEVQPKRYHRKEPIIDRFVVYSRRVAVSIFDGFLGFMAWVGEL